MCAHPVQPALRAAGRDRQLQRSPHHLLGASIDWADADEQLFSCDLTNAPSSNAVEDAWYQLLAPSPTAARTRPTTRSRSCTWCAGSPTTSGPTFVDPEPTNPKKRVMTVWGQGAVNVNSANAAHALRGRRARARPRRSCASTRCRCRLFVMGVTMAQGITMGAPLFGSPKDFIATMEGQGMLGPLLTRHGDEAREVPVRERLRQEHLDREQGLLDLRRRRRQGIQARDPREDPHSRRLPDRAVADERRRSPARARRRPGARRPGRRRARAAASPTRSPPRLQPSVGGQVLYFNIE